MCVQRCGARVAVPLMPTSVIPHLLPFSPSPSARPHHNAPRLPSLSFFYFSSVLFWAVVSALLPFAAAFVVLWCPRGCRPAVVWILAASQPSLVYRLRAALRGEEMRSTLPSPSPNPPPFSLCVHIPPSMVRSQAFTFFFLTNSGRMTFNRFTQRLKHQPWPFFYFILSCDKLF